MSDSPQVYEIFREKRKALRLTQQAVADKAGILIRQYQRFESGERDIMASSFAVACAVIEALGMNISDFYHGNYSSQSCDYSSHSVSAQENDIAAQEEDVENVEEASPQVTQEPQILTQQHQDRHEHQDYQESPQYSLAQQCAAINEYINSDETDPHEAYLDSSERLSQHRKAAIFTRGHNPERRRRQEEFIREFCPGLEIVEVYNATNAGWQTAIYDMIHDAKDGLFDLILIRNMQKLVVSDNPSDVVALTNEIVETGAALYFVQEDLYYKKRESGENGENGESR